MRDAELVGLLRLLEADARHAEPEPAFADELFDRLQAEGRRSSRLTRPVVLLIAALLLAMLVVATVVIGSLLRDPALELVRRSQAVHENPPPFSVLTTSGPIEWEVPAWYTACADVSSPEEWRQLQWRYDYDGAGSFRQACMYGGSTPAYVGGLEVQTPEGHGVWGVPEWELVPGGFMNRPAGAPLATLLWLNWFGKDGQRSTCSDWELGSTEVIAGRSARAVTCGTEAYWIDEDSGLLLRRERDGQTLAEVVSLEIGPPAEDIVLYGSDFSTQLEVGRTAAPVTLPDRNGGQWSSGSLLGRRTAVLVRWGCGDAEACVTIADFSRAVATHGVSGVVIRFEPSSEPSVEDAAAADDAGVPIVADDQSGWPRWEYPILAGLLLFDADGTLVAVVEARTSETMVAALQAFTGGRPIPPAPVWDGYFAIGEPLPALTGTLLGGGAFDSGALAERPLVVLSPGRFVPGTESGCPVEPSEAAVRALNESRRSVSPDVTFAVLAWGSGFGGSPFDGWEAFLADLAVTPSELPVVAPDEPAYGSWGRLTGARYCGTGPILVAVDRAGLVRFIGEPPPLDELVALLDRM